MFISSLLIASIDVKLNAKQFCQVRLMHFVVELSVVLNPMPLCWSYRKLKAICFKEWKKQNATYSAVDVRSQTIV